MSKKQIKDTIGALSLAKENMQSLDFILGAFRKEQVKRNPLSELDEQLQYILKKESQKSLYDKKILSEVLTGHPSGSTAPEKSVCSEKQLKRAADLVKQGDFAKDFSCDFALLCYEEAMEIYSRSSHKKNKAEVLERIAHLLFVSKAAFQ